jgi:hypothetical protein
MPETGQDFFSLFDSLNKGWYIVRTVDVKLAFLTDMCRCVVYLPMDISIRMTASLAPPLMNSG